MTATVAQLVLQIGRGSCQFFGANADNEPVSVLALLVTAAFAHGGPSAHAAAVCPDFPDPAAAACAVGPSVTLAPVRRTSGCHVSGKLPDRRCTPGARFAHATRAEVCTPGYSSAVRNVSSATKDAVYAAYGLTAHFDGSNGEVDHLVSLELGGSNARANLFPEAAPGSHEKDRLENELHAEVCDGRLRLRAAQKLIATNWVAAYRARFG